MLTQAFSTIAIIHAFLISANSEHLLEYSIIGINTIALFSVIE